MKVSVILGHPAPESFNHAIAQVAVSTLRQLGHEVFFHDLYAENFDPLYTAAELKRDAVLSPQIETHAREMDVAEGLVVVHPNYWSRPPAILCGWTDRVLRAGRAYNFVPDGKGGAKPVSLLKLRTGVVFNTANTPQEIEESVYGDPLEVHWRKVVFALLQVNQVYRKNFSSVIVSTPEQRKAWLQEVATAVQQNFPNQVSSANTADSQARGCAKS